MSSPRSICSRIASALALLMVVLPFGGCTASAPGYAQKLASARTDGKGDEIVGVWVSRFKALVEETRESLLLRPDGSGIWRVHKKDHPITWNYSGHGVWQAEGEQLYPMTFQFNGRELLVEIHGGPNKFQYFFVRSDDASAVEENFPARH